MKKILLVAVAMLMGSACMSAQTAQENYVKQTFNASIRCENCVKRVQDNVAALGEGVKGVEVNLEKKQVVVEYDANKTNPENIIAGFEKIRVKAELAKPEHKCDKCKHEAAAPKHECNKEGKAKAAPKHECNKEGKAEAAPKHECNKEGKAKAAPKHECNKEGKTEATPKHECGMEK